MYLISGTPAMFLSTDEDNDKIMCRADVPKDVVKSKGLDAREWCDQVKELIGGKGKLVVVHRYCDIPTESRNNIVYCV